MIWISKYFTGNNLILKLSSRPIAGYANLCPNMISTQAQEFVGMLSTVKHEIIHALVRVDVIICVSLKLCLLPHTPPACCKRRVFGGGKLLLCLPQFVCWSPWSAIFPVHLLWEQYLAWHLTLYVNISPKVSMSLVFNLKGFSAGLFAFYRDDDGKPLTTRYADGFPPFNERYFIFSYLFVLPLKDVFALPF